MNCAVSSCAAGARIARQAAPRQASSSASAAAAPLSIRFSNKQVNHHRRRGDSAVVGVGWDPEGILAAPVGGHIARRELAKAVQTNAELAERVEAERQKAREELVEKRASRNAPLAPGQEAELVTYFLDTESDEMEFEIARCRPALTEAFFKHVDSAVGELRFAKNPDEGKLAELEVLRDYLRAGVEAFDANVEAMKQPAARMRKLLTAPDKKATLLQMAGDGEVDQALINLLQQNIDAARSAGQEEPVKFLEKVRDAARKFVIT